MTNSTSSTGGQDPISLMMQMLANSDSGKYDSKDQSVYYMIASLIAKIEGIGDQVTAMANESNAFSTVKTDTDKVRGDITRIQQWKADHPNATMTDALLDPEYQADVASFKTDMTNLRTDSAKYNGITKYHDDGMGEAVDGANTIWSDNTINWNPGGGGSSESIGEMIINGKDGDLSAALFTAASDKSTTGGTFNDWTSTGKGGAPGLDTVSGDFGTFGTNLSQALNVAGTNLQQDVQVGQNFNSGMGGMMSTIINNFRS